MPLSIFIFLDIITKQKIVFVFLFENTNTIFLYLWGSVCLKNLIIFQLITLKSIECFIYSSILLTVSEIKSK